MNVHVSFMYISIQLIFIFQPQLKPELIWRSGNSKPDFLESIALSMEHTSPYENHVKIVRTTSTVSQTTASICKVTTTNTLMLIEALVKYKKRFLDFEIGWQGSVGDCRIFENSYLNSTYEEELAKLGMTALTTGDETEEEIPAFILRDSAYRNSCHLVTMYKVMECKRDASICHLNFQLSRA